MKKSQSYLFKILLTALMTALKVVLDRFLAYNVWNQRIGFSFIAVAFSAAMLGPAWSMLTAGLGDLIGAVLFPTGAYFPGFTAVSVLTGLCTGLFIHKNATLPRIATSVLINHIFGSVILNSIWIALLYNKSGMPFLNYYFTLLPLRAVQALLMTVIQIATVWFIFGKNSTIRSRLEKVINRI